MASIKRRGSSWQATVRIEGRERTRTFARQVDARRWAVDETSKMNRGEWIDPSAGKVTFGAFAAAWQASQVHRDSTAILIDSHVRNHMLPAFGSRPMVSIRPSEVQTWIKGLSDKLAPGTVRVVVQHTKAIFAAAVLDKVIAASPCARVKLPQVQAHPIAPLEVSAVHSLIAALPERYRGLAVLGAGAGLRPGEALGVTVTDVDFLRRSLTIRHQLVTLPGRPPVLAEPKTSSSERTVPLPSFVTSALAWHMERYEPGEWGLLFTTEDGAPIARNRMGDVWRAAVKSAGLPAGVRFHDLRHFYASALIHAGESVKVVQDRLGHASAVETLNCYSHLWPASEDKTRAAIDTALGVTVTDSGAAVSL